MPHICVSDDVLHSVGVKAFCRRQNSFIRPAVRSMLMLSLCGDSTSEYWTVQTLLTDDNDMLKGTAHYFRRRAKNVAVSADGQTKVVFVSGQ